MKHVLESEDFLKWFETLKHLVETNCLTIDPLDPEDFVEHFIDEYDVLDSIEEFFGFTS